MDHWKLSFMLTTNASRNDWFQGLPVSSTFFLLALYFEDANLGGTCGLPPQKHVKDFV